MQNDDSRTQRCPVCEAKDGLQLDIVYMKQNIGWHWRFSLSEADRIWHCKECQLRGTPKQLERRADTLVNKIKNRLHQGETLFVDVTYGDSSCKLLKLVPLGGGKYERFWCDGKLWESGLNNCDIENINSEVHHQIFENEDVALQWAAQLKDEDDDTEKD